MLNNLLNADHFILFGHEFTNHISLFGKFDVYFYAIAIVTGMILCCVFAVPLFKRRGENPELILDLMIGIVPLAIIGARLWYVLFDITHFHSFFDVINIRDGGLAIYGGVAGGALGIFIVCKIKKISIIKIFDFGNNRCLKAATEASTPGLTRGSSVVQQPAVVVPLAVHLAALGARDEARERLLVRLGVVPLVEGHVVRSDALVQGRELPELRPAPRGPERGLHVGVYTLDKLIGGEVGAIENLVLCAGNP